MQEQLRVAVESGAEFVQANVWPIAFIALAFNAVFLGLSLVTQPYF